jgi:hypothetical protein
MGAKLTKTAGRRTVVKVSITQFAVRKHPLHLQERRLPAAVDEEAQHVGGAKFIVVRWDDCWRTDEPQASGPAPEILAFGSRWEPSAKAALRSACLYTWNNNLMASSDRGGRLYILTAVSYLDVAD